MAFSAFPPAAAPMPAPAAPANAPASRPIAVIGPTPGINAATTSGPADSPALLPATRQSLCPFLVCSVLTVGTDCNSAAHFPEVKLSGVKSVTRPSDRPAARIWPRAPLRRQPPNEILQLRFSSRPPFMRHGATCSPPLGLSDLFPGKVAAHRFHGDRCVRKS